MAFAAPRAPPTDPPASSAEEASSLLPPPSGGGGETGASDGAQVHRRAAPEPRARRAGDCAAEWRGAIAGRAKCGDGGAGRISDRERLRRRWISAALTILFGCLMLHGLLNLAQRLYKPRHLTFGPGEEEEARRRQHCAADTLVNLELSDPRRPGPVRAPRWCSSCAATRAPPGTPARAGGCGTSWATSRGSSGTTSSSSTRAT